MLSSSPKPSAAVASLPLPSREALAIKPRPSIPKICPVLMISPTEKQKQQHARENQEKTEGQKV